MTVEKDECLKAFEKWEGSKQSSVLDDDTLAPVEMASAVWQAAWNTRAALEAKPAATQGEVKQLVGDANFYEACRKMYTGENNHIIAVREIAKAALAAMPKAQPVQAVSLVRCVAALEATHGWNGDINWEYARAVLDAAGVPYTE